MWRLSLLLLSCTLLLSFGDEKISAELRSTLFSNANKDATENIWVTFKDRGSNPAKSPVSEKAMNRRKRNGIINGYNEMVSEEYISSIMGSLPHVIVRGRSEWLNAISLANVSSSEVTLLQSLDFISKIDRVGRYVKITREARDISPRAYKSSDYGATYTQLNQINVIEAHNKGFFGQNVVIAVLDSGFRTTHRAFRDIKILKTFDFVNNRVEVDNTPTDPRNQFHHGTQVLSTIGGFDNGSFIGAAFKAEFLLAKTESLHFESQVEEDFMVMGIEWAEKNGADILSSSLGYRDWWKPTEYDGRTSRTSVVVDIATDFGLTCVISAGNEGDLGISVPADAFKVISVGSVNANGKLSYFSSMGPTSDNRIKPEVVAMGGDASVVSVTSNDLYARNSGTSFSAPIAAGAIAVLLSAHPTYTAMNLRHAILNTSNNAATPNNQYGWGLLDIKKAIDFPCGDCAPFGKCVEEKCECDQDHYGELCEIERFWFLKLVLKLFLFSL
ncbi:subtilisin [Acrasis kona]|uniref:Subtilisin n=1 Tax=Acrasis kona TaxID=1008807 RepID=A0AAW2ZG36_9EUKA